MLVDSAPGPFTPLLAPLRLFGCWPLYASPNDDITVVHDQGVRRASEAAQ